MIEIPSIQNLTVGVTISSSRLASPLGVCVWPEPLPNKARTTAYPQYIHEILKHAGVCYASITPDEIEACLPDLRVLVTVGEADILSELQTAIQSWVENGGAWLSLSGVCGLANLFGVELVPPAFQGWGASSMSPLGEGYLGSGDGQHRILGHLKSPLHFFNGISVRCAQPLATSLDKHGRPTERTVVAENRVGDGLCLLLAPDITGTIVRIQQGVAVTRDGLSSHDGLGPCGDGVLKTDDGMVLDWFFDRQSVEGVPGFSAFLQPVADLWREVVLRCIFYLASECQVPLPLLWFYPRALPALGHISLDTDHNVPEQARLLLDALALAAVPATWCTICPGYEPEIIEKIRQSGHELAMHFDAMTEDHLFTEEAFDRQWRELTQLFGEAPVSNKNHYLRWEGDTEFFEWCQKRGIEMDQSKGASKTGEAGFNFGTCHPYFPVSPDGSTLDVLELPTPTQDLCVFAPRELLAPLLESARWSHGILHLLFHPAHIAKPGVVEVMVEAAINARQQGMEWWTARQINEWERARRSASWSSFTVAETRLEFVLEVGSPLPEATVLWLQSDFQHEKSVAHVDGVQVPADSCEIWGFRWGSVQLDAQNAGQYRVEITP